MSEWIQVGDHTHYINGPSKAGIFQMNQEEVCLIDSGNHRDAGKKILKELAARGLTPKMIINTHSHADHIGGNLIIHQRFGCAIYAPEPDVGFVGEPLLEPIFLYGAAPIKALKNKFLMAEPSPARTLTKEILPEGLNFCRLDGHSFSQVGIKTKDQVWFLADALLGEEVLKKHAIPYLVNVEAYRKSLEQVRGLEGRWFIPSHGNPVDSKEKLQELVTLNLNRVDEIENQIMEILDAPKSMEQIMAEVMDHYRLTVDVPGYHLTQVTLRAMLTRLCDAGQIQPQIKDNRFIWESMGQR